MDKIHLLQYVILMTSTLIPNFRILSTSWTVANISFAGQYKSYAGTLTGVFFIIFTFDMSHLMFLQEVTPGSPRPDFVLEIFSN